MSVIDTLNTERLQAHHQAKEILDRCVEEKRERTAEEDHMFAKANADYDRINATIAEIQESQRREVEANIARAAHEEFVRPEVEQARNVVNLDSFRRILNGEIASVNIDLTAAANEKAAIRQGLTGRELRASLLTDGGASAGSLTVPTTFERTLYEYMEASSAVRRLATVITTSSGEQMKFPKVGTHGVGTQVIAQGTAIGGTEPVFSTMTLDAYKYGALWYVSPEFVQDTAIDVLGFLGANMGRAIGRLTDTAYVTGSGSGAPNGVVNATGSVVTGGSLIEATFESLINLQFSIVDEYQQNAAWLVKDSTAGTLRKIREDAGGTTGAFIWQPSIIAGQPDLLLGKPVYLDGNVAAQGSAAKSVVYGDFSTYYIRDVNSVQVARSDDFRFDTDLISLKATLRTDGDMIDANAIKTHIQRVT